MRIRRKAFRRASTRHKDNTGVFFGAVSKLEWTTNDANANCLLIDLPAGGAIDVPVLLLAQTDADYGYFNGRTESLCAIEDADGDSYIGFGFSADDKTELLVGGSATELVITAPTVTITSSTAYDIFSPSIDLGFDTGAKLTLAVTDATGVAAITHTGSGATMAWTVPEFTFTCSTSVSTFTPSWVMGFDVGAAMTIATTDTTGAVAITHAGSGTAVTWAATSLAFTGNFSSDGATASLDGSTSAKLISAALVGAETPDIRLGISSSIYMKVAVTDTTGAVAITHTGTGPAVTWAADSLAFTGDLSSDGATALFDGSTSFRGVSAGFTSLEAPANRFGISATIYTNFAVADTTGNLTITHVGGSTDLVTWTAAGGFSFVGATAITGTLGCSGTLSVGLDATAGTLELYPTTTNSGTTTLTMADNSGDTITNIAVAVQTGARTYTVPDAGASATFLMTDSYKTWWSFACGLSGEDTDGAGTNGAGMTGGAVDITTNQFNDSAGTVFVKVYDHGTTTWDDLSTSALLTAGADWTNNYQLQPDADAEEANDAVAVGFASKFCEICFDDLATGGGALATYGGDAGKWQYSTGAGTWSDLTVYDGTDLTAQDGKRPFQRAGAISFAPPSDWVAATYDSQEAYWVQWIVTAAQITQTAIIDSTNFDEPFVVIPNADAFDAPFKATIGEIRVTDMGVTVHDAAVKFIVGNFTTNTFTEEFTWTASQYNDTFTPATPLAVAADDKVAVLITDDAGSTVNPVLHVELEATYLD